MLDSPQNSGKLTREQKMGFIFMLIFAVLTVGLGALQLRNTIYGPFVIHANINPLETIATSDEARLKSIDTDRDGLNDYDELQTYETSPYLPDSDSDGFSDKIEIEKGTDPLCAQGKQCAQQDTPDSATSTFAASFTANGQSITPNDVLATTESVATKTPTAAENTDLQALINNPNQLRAIILSTGKIDAATLEKIDDATLQKMAIQLFSGQTVTSPTSSPRAATTTVAN